MKFTLLLRAPAHETHELSRPEPGLTIVESKSYGRAPSFLMATGYEQIRSVVPKIAGDSVAAREVRLVLPETGVCSAPVASSAPACCGGPVPTGADACCAKDADAKENGEAGCGCPEKPAGQADTAETACCRSAA